MRIDHLAIYVFDPDGMKDFYVTYFGAVPNKKYRNPRTGLETYFLTFDGGTRIEIMSRPDLSQREKLEYSTGFAHLAFGVGRRENVDRLTERLHVDGYTIVGQPRVTGDGYYESIVLDPEGNRIEITE
ncbi:MAG: VOC family protein [Clostridiales bacterium]|nr:VOC family protein [Clostridiales bacterium]